MQIVDLMNVIIDRSTHDILMLKIQKMISMSDSPIYYKQKYSYIVEKNQKSVS